MAVSDVVADNGAGGDAAGGEWADCGAGALEHDEYVRLLRDAGLVDVSIEYTHDTDPGRHGAIVRATAPTTTSA